MEEKIKALLVQPRPGPFDALRLALEEQAVEIRTARNCGEAALCLWSERPPHLVFTDVQLADGNWADVLTLAARASAPVNVIVVAPLVDVSFYVQAIERGAFDFIVPPLAAPELLHVVRIAAENALARRRHQAVTNPPPNSGALTLQAEDSESEPAVAGAED
jgi:DNA-binding NtrC family response regulator